MRLFVDGVLGGEGDRAEHDDQHDEHVEELLRHDPVDQTAEAGEDKNVILKSSIYIRSVIAWLNVVQDSLSITFIIN